MENKDESFAFLQKLVNEINEKDKLHFKKINANLQFIEKEYPIQYAELLVLVHAYFSKGNLGTTKIAGDYMHMINDMRKEGLYFRKHGTYRCKNQQEAYENVYSKAEVMSYYMNALLVSQILWKHHFGIFMYFQNSIKKVFADRQNLKILDIGPGHGFFSFLIKKEFPNYEKLDIVDISETSLNMTRSIIGFDKEKIQYFKEDIFEYSDSNKYDFIVLGEVLEHLDNPVEILVKLSKLLNKDGILWITTPTNSPALDHVYLFHNKAEVFDVINKAGLAVVESCDFFAEDVPENIAIKNKVTNLVGVFCKTLTQ